jgi:hypothetical protein
VLNGAHHSSFGTRSDRQDETRDYIRKVKNISEIIHMENHKERERERERERDRRRVNSVTEAASEKGTRASEKP